MFNFFKKFNQKGDAGELPPNIPQEKGKAINLTNPFYHTSEHQEDEERINKNDPKKNLYDSRNKTRKLVSLDEVGDDISSGNEWESYGENIDHPEEEQEEEDELTPVLSGDSNEEEMDQAYKNFSDSLQEEETEKENEELEDVFEQSLTDDEIKQKIWEKYLAHGGDKSILQVLQEHINLEHKQKKISPREEKKIVKGMSPVKRVSSFDDNRKYIRQNYVAKPDRKDNLKTMSDQKKEKMTREKIAKFLDSQQG